MGYRNVASLIGGYNLGDAGTGNVRPASGAGTNVGNWPSSHACKASPSMSFGYWSGWSC